MTVEEIQARLEHLNHVRRDDEVAHGYEDAMYIDLLEYIAATAPEPYATLARPALQSQEIDFARHCS